MAKCKFYSIFQIIPSLALLISPTSKAQTVNYYSSFQEINPALSQAFPDLPSIAFLPDFNDELAVSEEQFRFRLGEVFQNMFKLTSPVTLEGQTLPAALWQFNGTQPLSKEQHKHMEQPEQFFSMSMTPDDIDKNMDEILLRSKVFTDTDVAEDLWFENVEQGVAVFNLPSIIEGISGGEGGSDMIKLRQIFGNDILKNINCKPSSGRQLNKKEQKEEHDDNNRSLRYNSDNNNNRNNNRNRNRNNNISNNYCDLYAIDTRNAANILPHNDEVSNTRYSVGAYTLLQKQEGKFKPVAISVSMFTDELELKTKVFSKHTSEESQWRMAMLAATSSCTQWGVAMHIYTYHLVAAAWQRSFMNNINRDHVLYDALLPFSKYSMHFLTLTMLNVVSLEAFPFTNDAPDSTNFMPVLSNFQDEARSDTFYGMKPSNYLRENDIRYNLFAQNRNVFQTTSLQLRIERATRILATNIVKTLYPNRSDVRMDSSLQSFVSDLVDSGVDGLAKFSGNAIRTRRDLVDFLGTYLYLVVVHGSARTTALIHPVDTSVPCAITSFMKTDVVTDGDDVVYSLSDMMNHMPDSYVISKAKTFFLFFEGTTVYEPLIPKDGSELNLFENEKLNGHMDDFRSMMVNIMTSFGVSNEDISNWPANIES